MWLIEFIEWSVIREFVIVVMETYRNGKYTLIRDKMAIILQKRFFPVYFLAWKLLYFDLDVYSIQIPLKFLPRGQIDGKSALVQITGWCQRGSLRNSMQFVGTITAIKSTELSCLYSVEYVLNGRLKAIWLTLQ